MYWHHHRLVHIYSHIHMASVDGGGGDDDDDVGSEFLRDEEKHLLS